MTFLATHPIPAANLVKVAESVNVFTSLLWNILFAKHKKKSNYWFYSHRNYGLCVLQCFTSLCWFGLLLSAIHSFLLQYSPASERATIATEIIWVREWEEPHLRLPCTFHASDSVHQQSFQILSLPWSYHSSLSEVFLRQHGENEPMLYIRAEEMYQSLHRKSLKTMKRPISWSSSQHLVQKATWLYSGWEIHPSFFRFTTCNENSGAAGPFRVGPKPYLFEAGPKARINRWFNLEIVQNLINSVSFNHIRLIC